MNMKKQLSIEFFTQCPQLQIIQKPYALSNVINQAKIRDKQSEFELLRLLTETKKHKLRLRMNSLIENKKNRYPQQSIYQHSRVLLNSRNQVHQINQFNERDQKSITNLNHSKNLVSANQYINANFVLHSKKKVIVSQGPLQSTTKDFYQMIAQQNIECVLMLCQCVENSKPRCYDYLLNIDRQIDQSESNEAVQISRVNFETKFTHVFYKTWPDRGIPLDFQNVSKIIKQALKYQRILIHCSAGLGRSGVLAALLSILTPEKGDHKDLDLKKEVSVFQEVRRLRESRFQSVQNSQQYAFIYDFLIWYVQNRNQK